MALNPPLISFNAGELSPLIEGRFDLSKYSSGCRTLENMRPMKFGSATRRPGTEYIADAKNAGSKARMVKFQFSSTTAYMIEAGNTYLRFFESGASVTVPTASAWAGSTGYEVGDLVSYSSVIYYCLTKHTSGTLVPPAGGLWATLGTAGDAYEVTTPYSSTDVFEVQWRQINDVVYCSHPSHPPYKLSRFADHYWTMAAIDWTFPATRDENVTTTTLSCSHDSGTGRTLTASADLFDVEESPSRHVGSYWVLRFRNPGESVQLDIEDQSTSPPVSSALECQGNWSVSTSERWSGTVIVQRSRDSGSTWENIREFDGTSDRNITASGTETDRVQIRLKFEGGGKSWDDGLTTEPTGTVSDPPDFYRYLAKATLETEETYFSGVVKITAVASATSATVDIKTDLFAASTTTIYWSEGAWSDFRGYPAAVAMFEQRLAFASNDEKRQTIWFSKTDDFPNFEKGVNDTDAMYYTLAADEYNQIEWMVTQARLVLGKTGGEWTIGSSDPLVPLTPTNVSVRRHSNYGSKEIPALLVNDVIFFLQRQGRKVRELTYSWEKDGYVAPDMTILSEHITEGGIINWDYQQQPDAVLWAARNDGTLLGMIYERSEEVVGWFRVVTDGTIESVATMYGSNQDEVWMVVNRTIDGSTARYIERFALIDTETDKEDNIFLDSSLSVDYGAGSTIESVTQAMPPVVTITGHSFSDGDNVRITGSGVEQLDGEIFTVKNPGANDFELYLSDGTTKADLRNQSYDLTYSTLASNVVTVTTSLAHNFEAGDFITIADSTAAVLDGSWSVTAVTATTVTFQFPSGVNHGQAITGTIELAAPAESWSSGGTVTQVENTFVNLSHLEGESVYALMDGAVSGPKTVASGSATFDDWGNVVHVGLTFTSTLKPMKIEVQGATGASTGKTKKISEATIRFHRSMGVKFGETNSEYQEIPFRQSDDPMDASPPLYTGDKKVYFTGGSNKSGDMVIFTDLPFPMTVLAIIPKIGYVE